jgi:hypothetical protein
LPTPPELAHAVDAACQEQGVEGASYRRLATEEFKLQYYFGGQDVAYLETPAGRVVVAAGTLGLPDFDAAWQALSPEERLDAILVCPEPWPEEPGPQPSSCDHAG